MTTTEAPEKKTKAQIDAEVAKLNAEAEAALSVARMNDAQAQFHLAAASKAAAEADTASVTAAKARYDLALATEKEYDRIQSDAHHHVYQFSSQVDSASADRCMAQLRTWDRQDPTCAIEIIFNSPGGAVISGMALFDLIVRLSKRGGGNHLVTVGAQGYAASMGGILLQSGDVRWIGAQSYLMIHEISAGTQGKIEQIKDDVKFYEAICARVVDIFVSRSKGKITKTKFIQGWKRTDWWLLSDESLKLGFVDEIR